MSLRLDWCSYEAAKYAVEHWHYSKKYPPGKNLRIGVWENGIFIGVIVYGQSACPHHAHSFNFKDRFCVVELVRIALRKHIVEVTRIVSISLRILKQHSPLLKIVVSYADPQQGHYGKIYQAGNWIFLGSTGNRAKYYDTIKKKEIHGKSLTAKYPGKKGWAYINKLLKSGVIIQTEQWKWKYIMPLSKKIRKDFIHLAKPYPKSIESAGSKDSVAPDDQSGEGGANPTPALHKNKKG